MRMCFRREGFHVAIRHEEHLHVLPSFRITHVLDVRNTDGHASLEQRKRLAIEVGELRVVVTFDWSRPDFILGKRHEVKRVYHHLHLCRVETRDVSPLVATGTHLVQAFVDAVWPRHDFVVCNLWIEQLSRESGLIVAFVVLPVLCSVLDWVGQEEHFATSGPCHRLHTAVLEESGLEDTFFGLAVEVVGFARGSCPDLCDIAIAALQRGERSFWRHYLPLRVV